MALILYVISVGADELAVSTPVMLSSFASIVPAFCTVTIYVADAPGYNKSTSNVADSLSPGTIIQFSIILYCSGYHAGVHGITIVQYASQ